MYVIEKAGTGEHKIGVSIDPLRRISELQRDERCPLRFAAIYATPSKGFDIERAAQASLDSRRVSGEWFDVPAGTAIAAINGAAQQINQPMLPVTPRRAMEILAIARQPRDQYLFASLPWFLRWPLRIIISVVIGAGFGFAGLVLAQMR